MDEAGQSYHLSYSTHPPSIFKTSCPHFPQSTVSPLVKYCASVDSFNNELSKLKYLFFFLYLLCDTLSFQSLVLTLLIMQLSKPVHTL